MNKGKDLRLQRIYSKIEDYSVKIYELILLFASSSVITAI